LILIGANDPYVAKLFEDYHFYWVI
jgi:hypothetical protein